VRLCCVGGSIGTLNVCYYPCPIPVPILIIRGKVKAGPRADTNTAVERRPFQVEHGGVAGLILGGTATPRLGMLERARRVKDHCRRCENDSAGEYGSLGDDCGTKESPTERRRVLDTRLKLYINPFRLQIGSRRRGLTLY